MYLVIKLHFEGSKYEYGIPLNNAIIWLRAFGSLMRWKECDNKLKLIFIIFI
jgi:hypothetical protein